MKKQEKSIVNKIFITVFCIVLSIYAISIILTLCWGLLASVKGPYEYAPHINNWLGFPTLDESKLSYEYGATYLKDLKNYMDVFNNYDLVEANCKKVYVAANGERIMQRAEGGFAMVIVNTIIYTVVGAFLHTLVPALTAYAVAKFDNVVGKLIAGAALFAMTMPIFGSQPSMLHMLRGLGIYNTFWGYLLQKASFTGMYFFTFRAFYEGLPDSYSEAAEIDGASYWHILINIIIPLSVKPMSTVFVLQFTGFWNDYQTAYMYMPTHPTLAYVVWFLTNNNQVGGGEMGIRVAASMMLALPILMLFIVFKDKLMGNVSMGGLKQ